MENENNLDFIRSEEGKALFASINSSQRRRFSQAFDSELLAKTQYLNDFQIVSENIAEWSSKISVDDKRYAVLSAMSSALIRIYCYNNTLETRIASAISEFQDYRNKNNELLEINLQLKHENEALKNQVEHYENEGNF